MRPQTVTTGTLWISGWDGSCSEYSRYLATDTYPTAPGRGCIVGMASQAERAGLGVGCVRPSSTSPTPDKRKEAVQALIDRNISGL